MSIKKSKSSKFVKFVPRRLRARRFKEYNQKNLMIALAFATGSVMLNPVAVTPSHATATALTSTCAALEGKPTTVTIRSNSEVTLAVGDTLTASRPSSSTFTDASAFSSASSYDAPVEIQTYSSSTLVVINSGSSGS